MTTGVSGAGGSLKLECRTYTGTDAPAARPRFSSQTLLGL